MDPVEVGVMDWVPVALAVLEGEPVFDELLVAVAELEDEPVALPLDV
jgi:hypothetical protein